jgi:hypothetical protein
MATEATVDLIPRVPVPPQSYHQREAARLVRTETATVKTRNPLRTTPGEYLGLALLGVSAALVLGGLVAILRYPATVPDDTWHRFGVPALVLAAGILLGLAAGYLLRYKPTRSNAATDAGIR